MELFSANTDEVRRLASRLEQYSQALDSLGETPAAEAGFGTGPTGELVASAYRSARSAVRESQQQLTEAVRRHAAGVLAAASIMDDAQEEARSRAARL